LSVLNFLAIHILKSNPHLDQRLSCYAETTSLSIKAINHPDRKSNIYSLWTDLLQL
jgi:hypothetical protein